MKRLRILTLLVVLISLFAVPTTMARKDMSGSERVLVHFVPGQKAGVRNALLNANGQIHLELDQHNVIAVTLPTAALNGISRNPNVTLIEADAVRELDSTSLGSILVPQVQPYGVGMVQAPEMWAEGFDGEDVIVCIIDTGFYDQHEDLAGIHVLGGTSIDGFAYNEDGNGHGSHVAGTIAAVDNEFGVIGVSPGVSLFIHKIFDNDGLWVNGPKTTASNLIAAADSCVANGADIISMSLGGGSPTKLEEKAFDGYYAAGVLSIAAAGNDNDPADETTWGVLHYPASYPSVVSVAAIDEDTLVADFSQRNETLELSAPGVDVLSTIPYVETNLVAVADVDYSANHIEYSQYGVVSAPLVDGGLCTAPGAFDGMVVLCERGDISFADKVVNAEAGGAAAVLIYNNDPGNFLGTMGEEGLTSLVALSLSQEDGRYLVANKLGDMATVFSELDKPASGYEAWGGTSMATPHVSAVAALIWDACPSATNEDIRQAMMDSAVDLGEAGWDYDYGYGLVQAYDAMVELGCGGGTDPDTTPPVISNIKISVKGRNTTISWSTDEPTTGLVEIVGVGNYTTALGTSHSVTVRISSGPYTFHITATDEAGNWTKTDALQLP